MSRFVSCLLASAVIAIPSAAHAQAPVVRDSAHRAMAKAERAEKREERREAAGKKEAHPAIRAAIKSLEHAKMDLERANHDFGGHRADALKSVDEAIKQLRLALDYDKK